jgi:hypothetical protein
MARRRGRAGWIGLLGLLLFMAIVVYSSLEIGGVRCEVCITYRGNAQCRTVDGATEDQAREAAITNACAHLASGVTDGMACARTPPTRVTCTAR